MPDYTVLYPIIVDLAIKLVFGLLGMIGFVVIAVRLFNRQPNIDMYETTIDMYETTIAALTAQLAAERDASRIADANLAGELELAQDRIAELEAQVAAVQAWLDSLGKVAGDGGRDG